MAGKTLANKPKGITISGTVVSGFGEGRYFMSQEGYLEQMQTALHYTPYAGTLNIKVPEGELHKITELKRLSGIELSGFEKDGKRFGGATIYPAELSGVSCAVIIPKLSRHSDIIELIAEKNLRNKLSLSDGSSITVMIVSSDS